VSVRQAPDPLGSIDAVAWDALLDVCAIGDPLRRMSVLAAICGATGRDGWMVAVHRDGHLVAGAPVWPERERGLRVWRHLGHSLNWFSPSPPALDAAAREELAGRLLALPGDVLTLEELHPDDPLLDVLRARTTVRLRPESPTYRVRTTERRASMHRRRREVGRMMRRATDRGAPFEIEVTESGAEIASVLPELLALQVSAWSDREADHMTASPEGRALVSAILGALATDERLHLVRVRSESQTVGFALSALAPPRAVMFKTAHDRGLSGVGWIGITSSLDRRPRGGWRPLQTADGRP
jgi:Acetyltransferase (GNAT) domain